MTTKTKKTTIESTTEELRALMKDAETLLEKSGDSADEKVIELRERLSEMIGTSRDQLDRAKAVAQEKLHQCDDYVRSHPYHAVGVAAGVGAIIALLASRRAA